jgi:alpha-1,2-mannosyltransferase
MYGTEPWYWYLMNGFVNLGITWPFVLAAPAVYAGNHAPALKQRDTLSRCVIAAGRPFSAGKAWRLALAKGPIVLPPALWTAFLSLLPHKEERFLAVVFPIACFTAADCISQLLDIAQRVFPRFLKPALLICLSSFTALAMLLGALRCAAIVSNYGASLAIWASVSTLPAAPGTIVCVGKEWQGLNRPGTLNPLPTPPLQAFRMCVSSLKRELMMCQQVPISLLVPSAAWRDSRLPAVHVHWPAATAVRNKSVLLRPL